MSSQADAETALTLVAAAALYPAGPTGLSAVGATSDEAVELVLRAKAAL